MSLATKRCRKTNTISVPHAKASVAHSEMRHAALCITGLAVFEDITHSTERPNHWMLAFAVHLPAQAVNVHIYDVGIGLNAHAPHLLENHRTCYDAPCVPAQVFQQHKFLGCEL